MDTGVELTSKAQDYWAYGHTGIRAYGKGVPLTFIQTERWKMGNIESSATRTITVHTRHWKIVRRPHSPLRVYHFATHCRCGDSQ